MEKIQVDLRTNLEFMVNIVLANFPLISQFRVNSLNETKVDPTMQKGSLGVIYGLQRYAEFLRYDID